VYDEMVMTGFGTCDDDFEVVFCDSVEGIHCIEDFRAIAYG
jgi:hypothetical protein